MTLPDSDRARDMGAASFAPGDVFLAATDVDDSNVDLRRHAGDGRILHYSRDFVLKGEMRTGQRGLVIGIDVDETRAQLAACDSQNRSVTLFDKTGQRLDPWPWLPAKAFGSVFYRADGTAVLGVHSDRAPATEGPKRGPFVVIVDPAAHTAREVSVDFDGGRQGFHRVTHGFLTPDGGTLTYVSENGRRVMAYDLAADRQLADLFVLPPSDEVGTCGMARHPDGRLMMATGSGASLFDAAGTVVAALDVSKQRGWSRLQRSKDGETFYISNFFEGLIQRRRLDTLAVVAEHAIGRKYSLTGIAEYAGGLWPA